MSKPPVCDGGEVSVGEGAAALKQQGNLLFKENRLLEAADLYRSARLALRDEEPTEEQQALAQALRLNLATCLVRMVEGSEPQGGAREPIALEILSEVVELCSEALEVEPQCAKALFRRGAARHFLSNARSQTEERRVLLQDSRKDLLEAARAEPMDRQVRTLLERVTEDLKQLPSQKGATGNGSHSKNPYAGVLTVLNDERKPAPPPPPPIVCSTCDREGHACCGKEWWVAQRAAWLGLTAQEVDREPGDFEESGSLVDMLANHPSSLADDRPCTDPLSDSEVEAVSGCLEAVSRPFPSLKRKLALTQAVAIAEDLWDSSD